MKAILLLAVIAVLVVLAGIGLRRLGRVLKLFHDRERD
jgi:hypothetical protein